MKLLNEQLEKKENRVKEVDALVKEHHDGFPEMEKQKLTYIELLEKYKVQLTEKQQDMIGIESRIQALNETLETLVEQSSKKEELIEVSEKRLSDIKNAIESSTKEYSEREERLVAITEKIDGFQDEYDNMVKTKEVIEVSINDSRELFQKLKDELDAQEKEIRDKESRISRLDFMSTIFRVSKVFGGVVIGLGFILIIIGFAYLFNIINLGEFNNILSFWILIIAAGGIIASGLLHYVKS